MNSGDLSETHPEFEGYTFVNATYEKNNIVARGKFARPGKAVCDLSANGVRIGKTCWRLYVGCDVGDDGMEAFERHRGLGKEVYVA